MPLAWLERSQTSLPTFVPQVATVQPAQLEKRLRAARRYTRAAVLITDTPLVRDNYTRLRGYIAVTFRLSVIPVAGVDDAAGCVARVFAVAVCVACVWLVCGLSMWPICGLCLV